jgi:phosphatidylglycerophosphatase A
VAVFIAAGGGLGLCPVAPGTSGSLAGILFAWLALMTNIYYGALIFLALSVIAVLTAEITANIVKQKDPRFIVIDEIAGMALALAWLPFTPHVIFIQFVLFRAVDIFKPFPIDWLDKRLPGGWGIVMDDIAAGIIVNLAWRSASYAYGIINLT